MYQHLKNELEENIRVFKELQNSGNLPTSQKLTKEQTRINNINYKKINFIKESLGLPSCVHAHHINPLWRYFDVDRYIQWNVKDIVFLSGKVHGKLHREGIYNDSDNETDIKLLKADYNYDLNKKEELKGLKQEKKEELKRLKQEKKEELNNLKKEVKELKKELRNQLINILKSNKIRYTSPVYKIIFDSVEEVKKLTYKNFIEN